MKKIFARKNKNIDNAEPSLERPVDAIAGNRRALSISDILWARQVIRPYIRHTPVIQVNNALNPLSHPNVHLKLDSLQVTGSFKVRGALTKILSMSEEDRSRGIIAASGGNHGTAVAYAARQVGCKATIYVPESINPEKRRYMDAWGAKTIVAGPIFNDALTRASKESKENGLPLIHNFADRYVICGQGTVGVEIMESLPETDVLIVAIGGGGLIGGISIAAHAINSNLRIIGVEPTGAPTLYESLRAGRVVKLPSVNTKAGTLSMSRTVKINFDIVQQHVEQIVLVTDEEMKKAAQWLWFEMGIAAELSGAASVAALMFKKIKLKPHEKVCALICGSGMDGVGS